MQKTAAILAVVAALAVTGPALASDHLFDGATAPGADKRGFGNPVAGNPSGTSGPKASPGTVPGEGNPNSGNETDPPAVDRDLVGTRSGRDG